MTKDPIDQGLDDIIDGKISPEEWIAIVRAHNKEQARIERLKIEEETDWN